jgi:hypothetical protein
MRDIYNGAAGPTTFGRKGAVITPGGNDLPGGVAKAIVCTAEGDVTLVPAGNAVADTITFTACPVGFSPPYQVRRVTAATGTWATVED